MVQLFVLKLFYKNNIICEYIFLYKKKYIEGNFFVLLCK